MKPLDKALMAAAGNVGGAAPPSNAWDIDHAELDLNSAEFWDISTAVVSGQPATGAFGGNPGSIVFKPDGTRMYIVGSGSDTVKEYSFDSPWDIYSNTLEYSFSVSTQAAQGVGLFFRADGLRFYVADADSDTIFEYICTTEWDVSTASYNNVSRDISSYETKLQGVFFKPDGKKMYTCGATGDDINEWDLDTAWDLANATYSQALSVSAQDVAPSDLFFKSDGTKMYVVGDSGNDINEYTIPSATAWDISTASYSQNFSVALEETLPKGIAFRPDGSRFYVIGISGDDINEYFCGDKRLTNVNAQEANPQGIFFKPDGTKMFIIGSTGDDVNEYTLSTAWDPSSATFVQSASVASQETAPTSVFFKPDGLTFYIVGTDTDTVYQYTCDDEWDLTNVTYANKSFNDLREGAPRGLWFKPDGSKMYCCGTGSDSVNEFNLTTYWDVSTASYVQEKSVISEDTFMCGVAFSAQGDKFYTVGYTNDKLYQYDLTTDWEVDTAQFSKSLTLSSVHSIPRGIYFKSDGTAFFTVGNATDDVVPWKIT